MHVVLFTCFVFVTSLYSVSSNKCVCDLCGRLERNDTGVEPSHMIPTECFEEGTDFQQLYFLALTMGDKINGEIVEHCLNQPCKRLLTASEKYPSLQETLLDPTCTTLLNTDLLQAFKNVSESENYPKTCVAGKVEEKLVKEIKQVEGADPSSLTMDLTCAFELCYNVSHRVLNAELPDCDDKYTRRVFGLLKEQFELQDNTAKDAELWRRCLKKFCFTLVGMRGRRIEGTDTNLSKAIDSDICLRSLEERGQYERFESVWNSRYDVTAKFYKKKYSAKDVFGFLEKSQSIRSECLDELCIPKKSKRADATKISAVDFSTSGCRFWNSVALPKLFDLSLIYEYHLPSGKGFKRARRCFPSLCKFLHMKEDNTDYDVRQLIPFPRCLHWIIKAEGALHRSEMVDGLPFVVPVFYSEKLLRRSSTTDAD